MNRGKFFFAYFGRNAAITATTMAGSRFATLTFLPQTRLMPTQKISTFPTMDRFARAIAVMTGRRSPAKAVILPCKIATGIAEKTAPRPIEQLMTIIMIKSSTDLVARME